MDGLLTDPPDLLDSGTSLFVKLAAVTKFIALLGDFIWLTVWMEIERF